MVALLGENLKLVILFTLVASLIALWHLSEIETQATRALARRGPGDSVASNLAFARRSGTRGGRHGASPTSKRAVVSLLISVIFAIGLLVALFAGFAVIPGP